MNITLTLTEEEANAMHDLLGWAGDTIGEILDDAKHDPEPDENDKEVVEIYEPLADICLRVGALIETNKEDTK